MRESTVVEQATEELAFRIASGAFGPGTKLPSVRDLASELGINPSTVQVVLGRLQEAGFVDAHRRVGFVVRDIRLVGGIETWRFLFRFSQRLPDLAARMLADVLSTRLLLVSHALRLIAASPQRFDPAPLRQAVDQLELLVAAVDDDDLPRIARAELHAVRMVIASAGQGVGLAVFNSTGEMLLGVPAVVRALYTEPRLKVTAWRAFVGTWESGTLTDDGVSNVESFIREWDVDTIKRFRAVLDEEQRAGSRGRRKTKAASA
ncbi:MAG: GntR family transcriptional regulator [Acidimicrobiales bacterium]